MAAAELWVGPGVTKASMATDRLAAMVGILFIASCTTRARWSPEREIATCWIDPVEQASWRDVTTVQGRFSIRLPRGSYEVLLHCIDSACGRIRVGAWTLEFDRGGMAGDGSLVRPVWAPDARIWTEQGSQRTLTFRTFHVETADESSPREERGLYSAVVATTLGPSEGLYLSVSTAYPEDVCEFLAAARTLEVAG